MMAWQHLLLPTTIAADLAAVGWRLLPFLSFLLFWLLLSIISCCWLFRQGTVRRAVAVVLLAVACGLFFSIQGLLLSYPSLNEVGESALVETSVHLLKFAHLAKASYGGYRSESDVPEFNIFADMSGRDSSPNPRWKFKHAIPEPRLNAHLYVWHDTQSNELFISFRGSESDWAPFYKDWVRGNLLMGKVAFHGHMVHEGFLQNYNSIKLLPLIRSMDILWPTVRIYVTGHSKGGAMALLAALDLTKSLENFARLQVVTFGQPAVANAEFLTALNESGRVDYQRIVLHRAGRQQDFVSFGLEVASELLEYLRFGRIFFCESMRNMIDFPYKNQAPTYVGRKTKVDVRRWSLEHSMDTYIDVLQEPAAMSCSTKMDLWKRVNQQRLAASSGQTQMVTWRSFEKFGWTKKDWDDLHLCFPTTTTTTSLKKE